MCVRVCVSVSVCDRTSANASFCRPGIIMVQFVVAVRLSLLVRGQPLPNAMYIACGTEPRARRLTACSSARAFVLCILVQSLYGNRGTHAACGGRAHARHRRPAAPPGKCLHALASRRAKGLILRLTDRRGRGLVAGTVAR
jgi:hypothetical protein